MPSHRKFTTVNPYVVALLILMTCPFRFCVHTYHNWKYP